MTEQNPYITPDAALDAPTEHVLYQPAFISFNGRIGRIRYLGYSMGANLILMLAMIPLMFFAGFGGELLTGAGPAGIGGIAAFALLMIASVVITVMYGKRRFNDLNRSGWWSILLFVPYVNLLPVIYLLFFPGTDGSNDYGPAPAANSTGVILLALGPIIIALLGIVAAILIPRFAGVT